ncbi:hypothetical protein [Planococcus salinus]|nr:hypothetical protein [Planococcus salinus]
MMQRLKNFITYEKEEIAKRIAEIPMTKWSGSAKEGLMALEEDHL